MGTRGNRIQLYIIMGTVFSAFCDGGPLQWRTFAMADRNLWYSQRWFVTTVLVPNMLLHCKTLTGSA